MNCCFIPLSDLSVFWPQKQTEWQKIAFKCFFYFWHLPALYAFITCNNNDKKAINFIVQYHTSKSENIMFYEINKMYAKKTEKYKIEI